jgi:hypothetical protein
MRRRGFREPVFTPPPDSTASAVTAERSVLPQERGHRMVPLLLWILGVPGLIIILLLLLGVIHI